MLFIILIIATVILILGNLAYQNKKHGFSTTLGTSSDILAVDVKSRQLRIGALLPRYCKIDDVIDVDMDVKTKKGHTIRNATIGSLVAGNVGALVGIASTRDKIQKITLRITLKDGSVLSSYIKEPKPKNLKDLERVVNIASEC
ncbi:hypothetical protein [Streptococcus gallolyticus]|uniref:hypothetical protein n=1 Tax=Streptococcus gallolyticus TaxID=315405 RepID=UPI00088E62B6|nr:hypothetical protein [Streptococcus gallolyticus]SDJ74698.1 hypothetical protein SAMN04487842_0769 [Streptococcus gallolyticus]SDL25112.1 hypothetical protein SAMN04487841_0772 [Streptococcus gallolyticus]